MVLDLGRNSLFRQNGLEQDSGRLSDRWGQDGSVIKNFYVQSVADDTLYTVTSGKRLYVNTISILSAGVAGGKLRDANGGTIKLYYEFGAALQNVQPNLSTPLYFDTSLYVDSDGGTVYITVSGWEEDLP